VFVLWALAWGKTVGNIGTAKKAIVRTSTILFEVLTRIDNHDFLSAIRLINLQGP